jgi:hypothetical protein
MQEKSFWRPIASAEVDSKGAFMLDAGPHRLAGAPAVVVVAIDGHATLQREVEASTGAESPLVFEETDASTWHGRVVDSAGKPIPDLWVRFTGSWGAVTSDLLRDITPDGELRSSGFEVEDFARTRTDTDGRFVLRGTSPLKARLLADEFGFTAGFVSESSEWRIRRTDDGEPARRGLTPADEFVLVADPAVLLNVTVTDEVSGATVRGFEGQAYASGAGTLLVPRSSGEVTFCWTRWWAADEACDVLLAIEAPGFIPRFSQARFEPGARSAQTAVALTPATDDDTRRLRLEIVDFAGKPFDADWAVSFVDPTDESRELMNLFGVARTGAGVYEVAAPPGRWTLKVVAQDSLRFLRWIGEVNVAAAGTTTVRCSTSPHGKLVVRFPARGGPGNVSAPRISVRPAGADWGYLANTMNTQTELHFAAIPEGAYTVKLTGDTGMTSLDQRSVTIVRGEVSVVDFTK